MAAHAVPESVGSCSWEGMKSSHFLSTLTLPSACYSGSFQNLRTFLPFGIVKTGPVKGDW